MIEVIEGETIDVRVKVSRVDSVGAVTASNPQRRILNAARTLVSTSTCHDWCAASWDVANEEVYASFGSTELALSQPGDYIMQFRAEIGFELYEKEVRVLLKEWGV
jgi:hypothetical protein